MAASPIFKIYTEMQEYIASFKYPEDAALFVGTQPVGSTVRAGHSRREILWTEGAEEFLATSSFDRAAMVIESRFNDLLSNARKENTP